MATKRIKRMKRRRTSKGGMSQAEKNAKNRANRLAANLDDNLDDNLEQNVSSKLSTLRNQQNMKPFKGNNIKPLPNTIRIYNSNKSIGHYTNTKLNKNI